MSAILGAIQVDALRRIGRNKRVCITAWVEMDALLDSHEALRAEVERLRIETVQEVLAGVVFCDGTTAGQLAQMRRQRDHAQNENKLLHDEICDALDIICNSLIDSQTLTLNSSSKAERDQVDAAIKSIQGRRTQLRKRNKP